MGNRSRYLAVTAAAGTALLAARRRQRIRAATLGIGDTILPSAAQPPGVEISTEAGVGHAPGHRHLGPQDPGRRRPGRAPWFLHGRKTRHPYAPD